jgi:hypothetical protein
MAENGGLRLQPGEQVVLDMLPSAVWTWLWYVLSLGLWGFWRSQRHFVLTDQRVLACWGLFTKREESVPLTRVQDVHLSPSILTGGWVGMSSAGGTRSIQRLTGGSGWVSSAGGTLMLQRIGPLSWKNARVFTDAITERIHRGGGDGLGGTPPPAPSTAT